MSGSELAVNKGKLALIRPGAFDGLVSLESLNLNDNAITELPNKLFAGLRALRKVYNTSVPSLDIFRRCL